MATLTRAAPREQISQVPYLPGLDGLRAIAVVAVMIYHANNAWLHGGFLGVEVFFVISGYLITLLLIAEDERNGFVDLAQFWIRRARRLLPALFVMLLGVAVYTTLFYARARAAIRGDLLAAIFYVSNWFQIWVGAGYTAGEAFAPMRHLWSLAVEEQFYLLWPLIMLAILRLGRRKLPTVGLWLIGFSTFMALVVAVLYRSGDVAVTCAQDMNGYSEIAGRCISINDALYLSTISRSGGILAGAGFAMLWRPNAIVRGPLRDRAALLDGIAGVGMVILLFLFWHTHVVQSGTNFGNEFDPWLFRGGFYLTGVATLMIIAAVTHRESLTGRLLSFPVLNWIGTRSYGLYLYHWPIYQIIRKQAGVPLSFAQFVLAMAITLPITEASYRYIETPIRKGQLKVWWRRLRSPGTWQRPLRIAAAALAFLGLTAVVSIAVAPDRCVTDLECQLANAREATTTTSGAPSSTAPATVTDPGATAATTLATTIPPTTTVPIDERPPMAFGESVMLGAPDTLAANGITLIAAEAQQAQWILDQIREQHAAGHIGQTVIVQTGTNGTVEQELLDAIMAELPPDQTSQVVFLTVHAPKSWIEGNNERIRALPDQYPNVTVVDWDAMVTENPALLAPDGVHLANGDAARAYVGALVAAYATAD